MWDSAPKPPSRDVVEAVKVSRLIMISLAAGNIAMGVFALVVVHTAMPGGASPDPTIEYALAGTVVFLAVSSLAGVFLIKRVMLTSAAKAALNRHGPDDARAGMLGVYGTWLLVRGALFEGWGLLAGVALLLTGQPLFFIGSLASGVLTLAQFPSARHYEKFENEAINQAEMFNRNA